MEVSRICSHASGSERLFSRKYVCIVHLWLYWSLPATTRKTKPEGAGVSGMEGSESVTRVSGTDKWKSAKIPNNKSLFQLFGLRVSCRTGLWVMLGAVPHRADILLRLIQTVLGVRQYISECVDELGGHNVFIWINWRSTSSTSSTSDCGPVGDEEGNIATYRTVMLSIFLAAILLWMESSVACGKPDTTLAFVSCHWQSSGRLGVSVSLCESMLPPWLPPAGVYHCVCDVRVSCRSDWLHMKRNSTL